MLSKRIKHNLQPLRFCSFFNFTLTTALILIGGISSAKAADIVLYEQDFENPKAFVNNGADVNISTTVNQNYGNQPLGFSFAQRFTVETLLITGNQAFGTGYSDPSGIGGNYAIGMLSGERLGHNDDLLGLSFNVQERKFFNLSLDISSIDLSSFAGPFIPPEGAVPKFEFTLFDNPSGSVGLNGNGTILSSVIVSGTASPRDVFDWTRVAVPLDASGATNGNVTLRIDLLSGLYAAMDNFRIVASDTPINVPEPSPLFGLGAIVALGALSKLAKKPNTPTNNTQETDS